MLLRRLVLFGGKGGVGKTTLAAATALRLADAGARTLVVSTDPAHSLADVLDVRLGHDATEVTGRLLAIELDEVAAADAYVDRVREQARAALPREVLATVDRHLDLARHSPGTLEAAVFDRLIDLVDRCPDDYDRVVVDTAPTGHTLRLLAMPELLTSWVEGLTQQRDRTLGVQRAFKNLVGDDSPETEDPILAALHRRRDRLRRMRARLVDDATFHLVLTPERLPVEETARALPALERHGITVGAIVVNRVLPTDPTDPYLRSRRAQQDEHLSDLRERFAGWRVVEVEQRPRDVVGLDGLRGLAEVEPLLG